MRGAVLLLVAACTHPPPARIEHHAPPTTDETFELDAPLFSTDDTELVLWTLEHHGGSATFTLGSEPAAYGTFVETGDAVHVEVANHLGATTLDCHRNAAKAHVAGTRPRERGEHPVCTTPRVWEPSDVIRIGVLACTVHREQLVTEVTMAAPPGLQAIVDDCCDDDDRCERRWEIRLRRTREELASCDDCDCLDELIHRVAGCEAPGIAQLVTDANASRAESPLADHEDICRDYAPKLASAARSCRQ